MFYLPVSLPGWISRLIMYCVLSTASVPIHQTLATMRISAVRLWGMLTAIVLKQLALQYNPETILIIFIPELLFIQVIIKLPQI
ncbi:MAG TPA: hypothetical protein VEC36_05955 [Patescibacteria group bacterium]|nr:hypothetical protein [Patescibacteria group bacterium]